MIVLALVSRMDSITSFPDEFKTAIETVSLCTSIPIYLTLSIWGAPFGRLEANTQNLLQRSALLYCVRLSLCGIFDGLFPKVPACREMVNKCAYRKEVPTPCKNCTGLVPH